MNSITKEIDTIFGKYEEENPKCISIFEELLSKAKDQSSPATVTEE